MLVKSRAMNRSSQRPLNREPQALINDQFTVPCQSRYAVSGSDGLRRSPLAATFLENQRIQCSTQGQADQVPDFTTEPATRGTLPKILRQLLLRTGVVPADLRAALYKAAALIVGVTMADKQATVDGRTGIAVGIPTSDGVARRDIIIDPTSGLVIGEQDVLLKDYPGSG